MNKNNIVVPSSCFHLSTENTESEKDLNKSLDKTIKTSGEDGAQRFVRYNKKNGNCPICSSDDGRCRTNNNLIFCMEVGKDAAPESILNKWDYVGLTNNQDWHLWKDKQHSGKRHSEAKPRHKVVSIAPLAVNVIDAIYRDLVKEVGLDDRAKTDLLNRGINPDEFLGFSVSKKIRTQAVNSYGLGAAKKFPGIDAHGILAYAGEGYTCPAFDKSGRVIGYQVRYFEPDQPKYTWAATNNKIEAGDNIELPLTLVIGDISSKVLYFSEGLLKPFVASQRLQINVLGGAGGNLLASCNQLQENVLGYEQFIWAMDAGAIANTRVMRQYLRAANEVEKLTGIKVQYLWYDQISKEAGKDIDEITADELANARRIDRDELLAIATSQGINTSSFTIHEIDDEVDDDNQKPIGESQSKTLVITDSRDVSDKLKLAAKEEVKYFPRFSHGAMNEFFWELDVTKYSEYRIVRAQEDKYEPWSDSTGDDPKFLRWMSSHLGKLLGVDPIGDTRNELNLKMFTGIIETEDPYYVHTEKLTTKTSKGSELIYRVTPEGYKFPMVTVQTSLGVLPLKAVAFHGSDIPFANPARNTSGRYLPDFNILGDNLEYFGVIHGWKAPKGSGKTHQLNQIVKQRADIFGGYCTVTAIAPTINLNKALAAAIADMISINDYKSLSGVADNQKDFYLLAEKISLCLNSIGHLGKRKYDETHILILEEIETLLSGLLSPNSHYDKKQLFAIRKEFKRIIRETVDHGGLVICTDADLRYVTLQKLCEFAGVSSDKIALINHDNPDDGFPYAFEDDKKKVIGKFFEMLGEGKKLALYSDSKRFLEQVEEEAMRREISNVFVMNADTIAHPKFSGFTDNPDRWLNNNTPTVFCYNSVIGAGISMQYSNFDALFMFCHGVLDPDQIRQGSLRLRSQSIPRIIWAKNNRNVEESAICYKPSEIKDEIQENISKTLGIFGHEITPEILVLLSKANPLLDLHVLKLAREQYQSFAYRDAIEGGLLIAQKCKPFQMGFGATAKLTDAEKALQQRDSKLFEKAPVLSLTSLEFKKLDGKAYKEPHERAQWIKSITANGLPGVTLDQYFAIEYAVTSRGRNDLKKVKSAGNAIFTTEYLAIAKVDVDEMVNKMFEGEDNGVFSHIKRNSLRSKTLNSLGINKVISHIILESLSQVQPNQKALSNEVFINIDDEPIVEFLQKFTKNLTVNKRRIGLKFNGYLNRFEKLKRILRLLGIRVRLDSYNKTKLIVTLPYKFVDILIAHEEKLVTRYNELVSKGEIPNASKGDCVNGRSIKALLDKVSELTEDELSVLKTEIKTFFRVIKPHERAKTNTTTVTVDSSPPKIMSG